jgi:uncharacterized sulfatase
VNDVSETTNLATTEPVRAKALRTRLDAWLKSVDAQFPTANPDYDPVADANQGKKNAKAKNK